ncbi:protein scabrous [Lucilia cuprina]|uniref:protein scabrous n=1 Tax=Lucilia cuprina TaxID=7375 RepID=UPI001F0564F4|nr:protein scabrous [Lucilia cuprina]
MSLTNCSLLAVIMPFITVVLLTTGGFAGLTQASVINDMNNIMRDISTEVNTMSSPTTASTGMTTTTIRQMILRNSDGKKDNSDNYVNLDNTNDESISYSETSSGEILRFVNDNDNVNEDNDNNDDFIDMSIYNDKNNNNNNEIFSGNSVRSDNDISMSNTKNNYQIIDNNNDNSNYIESLTLRDQVRLLSKQLNVLMNRRREDYELLERNLRKSLRITQNNQPQQQHQQQNQQQQSISNDLDLRNELENLRQEVQNLRNSHQLTDGSSNKERLTIEWLQQSIGELRKQLVELQQIASNAMRDVTTRTQSWEDLTTIRSDFQQLKLELAALKERQQQTDVYVRELREETEQQEEEFQHFIIQNKQMYAKQTDDSSKTTTTAAKHDKTTDVDTNTSHLSTSESLEEDEDNNKDIKETSSLTQLADHRRRHCRFQRQQLHELQLSQRQLKRQFNELKYHRIAERVRSIEIEQHRIADANFNLSRQIASLDKLHSSMLELLEDVENVQTKVDKTVPELRHEISKLEFANAQLMSEQNLVREEGKNVARSLQAMAVSVSTLQDERDGIRRMQSGVSEMRTKLDRLQTMVEDVQRAIQHRQHRGYGNKDNKKFLHHHNNTSYAEQETTTTTTGTPTQNAESLVAKLENVEAQFESIIEKLPKDCSEVTPTATNANGGLYLIAPSAERHPLMAHCSSDGWTTIQRRYDGSADFNRSWEDYANGFGSPAGEFWMGNEQLHHLTLNNCTRLRVVMQDIYDNVWLADYTQFYISSRSDGYRLHIGGYSGNASDALDYQQGMQFSAIDVDRDISQTHCAANYEGGWWFSHCQHANLNGRYNLGLTWFDAARNEWIAVKSSQMMVKRQSTSTCQYIQESLASTTKASATMTTTTTTATTTTSASSSATINSNKSIPLNNLRIPGQTSSL